MSEQYSAIALVCMLAVAGISGCESQSQTTGNPDTGPTHFQKGLDYEVREDLEEAASEYKLAIRQDPRDSRAYVNLGCLYANAGQSARAERHYRKAVEVNPEDVRALNLLGGILLRRGDCQGAIACYKRAVAVDPEFANSHWNLAAACRSLGLKQAAAQHYRKYIELASPDEEKDLDEARRYVDIVGEK